MSGADHVALDLGAESGRAMLGRFDGERVELAEVRRFPTQSIQLPDGLYWNALGLYAELTAALAQVSASGARPRSIGVDSWGVDFGLVDRHGALLSNPLCYRDGRGSQALHETLAQGHGDEIYAATGIQFLPFNTLYQLLALSADAPTRASGDAPADPGPARLLADRRTGRGGDERQHDAARERPHGRVGERP